MKYLLWIVLFGFALMPVQVRAQGTDDPLAKALQQADVYVGKTVRDRVDGNALTTLTDAHKGTDRPLKIAVVTELPASGSQYGTRDNYTTALHRFLGLDRGTLIIVTGRGVSASTNSLRPEQITAILRQTAPEIKRDPVSGIRSTVQAIDAQSGAPNAAGAPDNQTAGIPGNGPGSGPAREEGPGSGLLWLIPAGVVGGLAVWGISKASAKRKAMQEAQIPVQRLRKEVVDGITYADNYLDLLPPSEELNTAVQQRQSAAELLEQAKGFAQAARTPEDYGRSQALLEQAKAQVDACRKMIDVATGGTSLAVAVDGTDIKATPATGGTQAAPVVSGLRPEDIPAEDRGACFFCSRPERISRMTPLTVALAGQRRKVLACSDCVRIVQSGAAPQVRTVEADGQRVPWYSARTYDPYRDYTHSQAYYAPPYYGYGPGNDGFLTGFLFASLLSNPYPMAYPVFVNPAGMYTNDFAAAAQPPQYVDTGSSSDFFGSNDAINDPGDSGGGVDFGGSGADWSDSGGGSDFGSSDFGSSDSGSDFGGSDFGGSDFGGGDSGGGGGDY